MNLLVHIWIKMTQQEFIASLKTKTPEDFFNQYIMIEESDYIRKVQIDFIKKTISEKMSIEEDNIEIVITGSCKLGYSLYEKKLNEKILPKYRPFSNVNSDIDVAVISKCLFEKCWDALSIYSCSQPVMPWDTDELGDYLLSGWIRPDKLPHIFFNNIWWNCFSYLSRHTKLGRLPVRVCLYYKFDYSININ